MYFFKGSVLSTLDGLFDAPDVKTGSTRSSSASSSKDASVGRVIDKYKGVKVYYNGAVKNVSGRHVTPDGYNIGLKYQCVEFAKRFYLEVYNHRMPDSYGHAKDFYDPKVLHGLMNTARAMKQYRQGGGTKPKADDLVVIGPSKWNRFGHLVILTEVGRDYVKFIQQNPGAGNPSRGTYNLDFKDNAWVIRAPQVKGWLRI